MNVVVAMDSFKGTMSAREACELVREGFLEARPDWRVIVKPMADGGEGTAEAMLAARGGQWIPLQAPGPLPGRVVDAGYAWFPDRQEALVEMASAAGLPLLDRTELNPMRTTTRGVGVLMRAAQERGAQRILLAVGGSATTDGGIGAASELGWQFLDHDGNAVSPAGEGLLHIHTIRAPDSPLQMHVDVLCDVNNPLTGPHGAAAVYGPQKGATPDMVKQLDAGLVHLAALMRRHFGVEMEHVKGAGASGGLAGGAIAFMQAELKPGIETIMEASGLRDALEGADWVITGEGKFDEQSLRGKVVSGISKLAQTCGTNVGVLAGSVRVAEEVCRAYGVSFALPTAPAAMPLDIALPRARSDLKRTAHQWALSQPETGKH
jgi:glycerate 2-kinase